MTDLIRAVFEEQADRAPDITGLRAAVARPARHRPRGVWVPALAALVVVGVLGVAVLLRPGPPEYVAPAVPTEVVAMPYRPAVLPPGFVETVRQADLGGYGWTRVYALGEASVSLTAVPGGKPNPAADAVFPTPEGTAHVEVQVAPDLLLTVSANQVPNPQAVADAAAASLVPDPTALFPVPTEFSWLPVDTFGVQHVQGGLDATGVFRSVVSVGVYLRDPGPWGGPRSVWAEVTRAEPQIAGTRTPVAVRGGSGTSALNLDGNLMTPKETLTTRLDDGRWLQVSADAPGIDLVRIADGLRIAPEQTHPWLGR